ncbi:MAG: hypothetical protein NTU53_01810 [Planctomycetota bacterium]|nr:hypothetical protein [Planctomycetota bacterium]
MNPSPGSQAHPQINAVEDTWSARPEAAAKYAETLRSNHDRLAKRLKTLHNLLAPSDMLAYLSMMALRLLELRRVLKPTGSIYLHCDPTASHYLKIVMDALFGPQLQRPLRRKRRHLPPMAAGSVFRACGWPSA